MRCVILKIVWFKSRRGLPAKASGVEIQSNRKTEDTIKRLDAVALRRSA
jgi:hypothetical protein